MFRELRPLLSLVRILRRDFHIALGERLQDALEENSSPSSTSAHLAKP